ncbi:GreA/GreB family elongation factor [Metapseudomonas furukawaii]|jgi:transcription elongation GreA/GreB family factor|uniref:GreA/GreB family elongation factor n=1 Tax=Metapseudomonas furukawaii TaxID=1149133 RepID=UPI00227BE467|nr:GreA/GreB family elongation factor [Pseudomonas furukawaii]WAG77867.1 GreA/GreB family elongation factor [Pseudomonas furukawaii]
MDKARIHRLILDRLAADLELLQRAAQAAYEAATHEENVAENKYDTLGLEASYLATGQARRAAEIKHSIGLFQTLNLRPFDPQRGIQLSALVVLAAEDGSEQWLFLGPEAAGLKVQLEGEEITVITPRSPLGQALLGKAEGAEITLNIGKGHQHFEVLQVH